MLQDYKFQYQHNCKQTVIVQHSTFSVGSFKFQVLAVAEALFNWNAHCWTIFTFPGTKHEHSTGHHGSIHLLRANKWTTVFIQATEGLQGAKKIQDYIFRGLYGHKWLKSFSVNMNRRQCLVNFRGLTRKKWWPIWSYCLGICLERDYGRPQKPNMDSLCPGSESNQ
jgi:hypothetical protein